MQKSVCKCIYKHFIDEPVTMWSMVFDFIFSLVIVTFGLILNRIYKKKLREEKRARPLHPKGNVIEPIMSWYLSLGSVFWPFEMTFLWMNAHEVLPADWFTNCWLSNLIFNMIRVGRTIIAYNSFFAALIRYAYIVHEQKTNQWSFERVGRIFQIASFVIPIILELLRLFAEEDFLGLKATERFKRCVAVNNGIDNTTHIKIYTPITVEFTKLLLPPHLIHAIYYFYATAVIVIGSNVVEAFFYIKIFQKIDR